MTYDLPIPTKEEVESAQAMIYAWGEIKSILKELKKAGSWLSYMSMGHFEIIN